MRSLVAGKRLSTSDHSSYRQEAKRFASLNRHTSKKLPMGEAFSSGSSLGKVDSHWQAQQEQRLPRAEDRMSERDMTSDDLVSDSPKHSSSFARSSTIQARAFTRKRPPSPLPPIILISKASLDVRSRTTVLDSSAQFVGTRARKQIFIKKKKVHDSLTQTNWIHRDSIRQEQCSSLRVLF